EDKDNGVSNVKCRRPQNSYRLMLERVGPWPGGPKPSPVAVDTPVVDAASSDAGIDVVSTEDAGGDVAMSDDDASALPPPAHDGAVEPGVVIDATVAPEGTSTAPPSRGCGCALGVAVDVRRDGGAWLIALIIVLLRRTVRARRTRCTSDSGSNLGECCRQDLPRVS
ncbi:MAG TPA: hypothetical protein VGF45_15435, partial [Polyangia bacterium]